MLHISAIRELAWSITSFSALRRSRIGLGRSGRSSPREPRRARSDNGRLSSRQFRGLGSAAAAAALLLLAWSAGSPAWADDRIWEIQRNFWILGYDASDLSGTASPDFRASVTKFAGENSLSDAGDLDAVLRTAEKKVEAKRREAIGPFRSRR